MLLLEPDDEHGIRPNHSSSKSYEHLKGKIIAELEPGEMFGEISAMYRNKCEASVRAKTSLEVIAIPRATMMRGLHRSNALMEKVLNLIRQRRNENDFYKIGRTNVATMAVARMAAHKLVLWVRKKMEAKAAAARASNGSANGSASAEDSGGGVGAGGAGARGLMSLLAPAPASLNA